MHIIWRVAEPSDGPSPRGPDPRGRIVSTIRRKSGPGSLQLEEKPGGKPMQSEGEIALVVGRRHPPLWKLQQTSLKRLLDDHPPRGRRPNLMNERARWAGRNPRTHWGHPAEEDGRFVRLEVHSLSDRCPIKPLPSLSSRCLGQHTHVHRSACTRAEITVSNIRAGRPCGGYVNDR